MIKAFSFIDLPSNCLCTTMTEGEQMLLELPHTLQMDNRYSVFFPGSNVHTVTYIKLATYELYNPNENKPCKIFLLLLTLQEGFKMQSCSHFYCSSIQLFRYKLKQKCNTVIQSLNSCCCSFLTPGTILAFQLTEYVKTNLIVSVVVLVWNYITAI